MSNTLTHNSKKDISYCRNNGDSKNGTCILPKVQKSLSKILGISYNESNPSETIKQIHEKLNLTNKPEYLILSMKIRNKLSPEDYELLKRSFKPEGPVDHTWLSNFDIQDIFKNYEFDYKDFKFLGATYNDFFQFPKDKYNNPFIDLQFLDTFKDKKRFGMVINHDNHGLGGSHWVGLYFDRDGHIYYFDSVGQPPLKEVKEFIQALENYFNNHNIKSITKINYHDHQHGNSECGVYSTVFLIRVIEDNEDIDYIMNTDVDDNIIHKFRHFIFNPKIN